MKLEPMIKMELKKFKDYYDINDDENIAFEKFVNFVLLSSHQPEAFSTNSYFIDSVHVGGENDMGIDGIGIKINETFVDTCQSVDDIIKLNNKINIEFIFVQSKYKSKFDSGEFGKFKDGMLDFLSEEHNEPHNDKIEALLKIKDYIFSEKIMSSWEDSPSIKFYYVSMGEWNENEHILAKTENFKNSVKQLNVYSEITDKYLDAKALKKMIDENNNKFSCILNVSNSFPLQEVEDVTDSIIISCKAGEIIKMLSSHDNSIKKSVFNDNVRDYQGNTIVNEGILKTIRENPQKFTLMNNGMTIICKKALQSNRKVTLENPQIVNGCQTANVIFEAGKKKIDLSNVEVIIKIIATESLDISNNIVKANNRQNIVYEEAFETMREFHKNLEEFVNSKFTSERNNRIYYERRSKQYMNSPMVKYINKFNFRTLIQSFVSIFMKSPHLGFRHEKILLDDFKNNLFLDNQSLLPYFLAVYINFNIEKAFLSGEIIKKYRTFKNQIMFIYTVLLAQNFPPSINNEKNIDEYCQKLEEAIFKDKEYKFLKEACDYFENIEEEWVKEMGESYRSAIKDSDKFTNFLLSNLGEKIKEQSNNCSSELRGVVIMVNRDKNNLNYGFISHKPDNIFFHQNNNAELDFGAIREKEVLYEIIKDKYDKPVAKINKIIQTNS